MTRDVLACAQIQGNREGLALHTLALQGFTTYLPRLRVRRVNGARKAPPALFPGYCFVAIELQWHAASKSPGIIRLVLAGGRPARVEGKIIDDLKKRERNGLIELPPAAPAMTFGIQCGSAAARSPGCMDCMPARRRAIASSSCSICSGGSAA